MDRIDLFDGENEFLSNFYSSPVEYEGIKYQTVEHAFQAAKTLENHERENIALLPTAGKAKRAGKKVKLRQDWEKIKLQVMEELLRKKFGDKELRKRLLATGNKELVEGNNWKDTFWGVCNGKGQNHLGRLLMKVREEIREIK